MNHSARISPESFPAYTDVSFDVVLTAGEKIHTGTIVEIQLPNSFTNDQVSPSKVKPWQLVDPNARHYIGVSAGTLTASDIRTEVVPREYVGGYHAPTRHGRCLIIELLHGSVEAGEEITVSYRNTTSSWLANQDPGGSDHEGLVLLMVDGVKVEPSPSYRVLPGPAALRRVIVPSAAKPGQPFRALLVSLDEYNNLSSSSYSDVTVTCEGQILAEDVAYTGGHALEVALDEPGIHRLEVDGVISNPIRISGNPRGPYWGDIHIHSYPSVDAMGNAPYEYARNVSGLDFAATAEHGAGGLKEHWAQTRRACREWHEPGRFVTILALETNTRWHHNIYFYDDGVPMVDAQKNGDSSVSPEEMLDYVSDKEVITQIHHTGWGFDMRLRYPDTTRLLEIYSMHGSSEVRDPESSIFMDKHRNREGDARIGPYYARDAWALGQRFVTHGSSDNHFCQGGVRHNSITAVCSDSLDRRPLLDAMKGGACYATTGERILLEFSINGHPMGSEFSAGAGSELEITVQANGTWELESVEVFGCPFIDGDRSVPVNSPMFADDDPAVDEARGAWRTLVSESNIGALDAGYTWRLGFGDRQMVYYARVTQAGLMTLPGILEGQAEPQRRAVVAWSSPIWILPEG